jgi:hypothetical protein
MAQEDKLSIDKLQGIKNWQVWKYQMKVILEARELWSHVDGTAISPDSSEDSSSSSGPSAQAIFAKAQRKTKALLVTSINSDLVHLITECETPKQIWDKFKKRFERNTVASKLFLKQKSFSLKMKDSDTLDEHLRRMKEITDQLGSCHQCTYS